MDEQGLDVDSQASASQGAAQATPQQELLNPQQQLQGELLWDWFNTEARTIALALDASTKQAPACFGLLEERLRAIDPQLGWEIGPHGLGLYLALSPQGDRTRLALTQHLARQARPPRGWTIFAAKPPKDWNRTLQFADQFVDAGHWGFYCEDSSEGKVVHWGAPDALPFDDEQRRLLARIVLECEVGEELALSAVVEVQLGELIHWPETARGRHISALWESLTGSPRE